jgi:hypothetical protein
MRKLRSSSCFSVSRVSPGVIAVLLAVAFAGHAQQQQNDSEALSLRGNIRKINSLAIAIKPLQPELKNRGLLHDDIEADVRASIKSEGIDVARPDAIKNIPGVPWFKLDVFVHPATLNSSPYSGVVRAALVQGVYLSREAVVRREKDTTNKDINVSVFNSNRILYAETLHTYRTFQVKDLKEVRSVVKDVVNVFRRDYGAINPQSKPSSR